MTIAPQIIYRRQRRRMTARRNPLAKLALALLLVITLFFAMGGLLSAFAYVNLTRDLPSIEILPALIEPPDGKYLQPTKIYDRSGEHIILSLEHPAAVGRQYLYYAPEQESEAVLSDKLVTATLASADPFFWQHDGAPLLGIILGDRSTLAKRLAVDILLNEEPAGLRRTLRTAIIGKQITTQYGREKILEWYLNSANYGRVAYGADAAARVYFGKPAEELTLAEAAMLAAASETPELNPMDAPQAALERQKRVIQSMLQYRMIEPEEGIQAARQSLTFRDPERQGQALSIQELEPEIAPAFARLVMMQLETQFRHSKLERGGMRVITTLDYDLQTQIICLAQVQENRLKGKDASQNPDNLACDAARLLPTLKISPNGSIVAPQSDIVVLDPNSGQILALTGQPPIGPQQSALETHSTGSLATPFLYLTGFTRGLSPASLVWDIPTNEPEEEIQNFDGKFHGPMRLRIALANDYLVPAAKVLTQVGINNVRRTLRQFSLSIPMTFPEHPSPIMLLDESDLLSASQAMGIFANHGVLTGRSLAATELEDLSADVAPLDPISILKVWEPDGQVIVDWNNPQRRPIITPELAYLMTDVLNDEPARWQSLGHPNALEVGRPAAVKLSRTGDGESHWAIGYTPQLVVGVWLGTELDVPSQETGEYIAYLREATAGLWHATTQYAHKDLPYLSWERPASVSLIEVCDPSGQLPTRSCKNTVTEVFLPGNEPVQTDTLYHAIPINPETNRLATVFTAPELIEERVYMMVPPEAEIWAQETGLDAPPMAYETIPINLPQYSHTTITAPKMFDQVRNQVDITGIAGGDDFLFYRIQVGSGMYPTQWLQIGEDVNQATTGRLATWDTSGLNGLYTIQLLVARSDQRVDRVNLLVTVDNQPPMVRIVAPVNGAAIDSKIEEKLVLRAEIEDEIGIDQVAFYLNEELLEIRSLSPYAITWKPEVGEYRLRIMATDQAGNSSEDIVNFIVE